MTTTEANAGIISEKMLALVRGSLPALRAASASDPDALVPVADMAPHFISFSGTLPENGLGHLFMVDLDGEEVHIYVYQ